MGKYNLPEKYRRIDGSTLKILALITMLIDHFAASVVYNVFLLPNAPIERGTSIYTLYIIYRVMRAVGRTAFPIYVFLLVEGFVYTKSRPRYLIRLLAFALISEIPFNLALKLSLRHPDHQNVFFELALCLLLLMLWEYFKDKPILQLASFAACGLLAHYANFDYGWYGIILVMVFYVMRDFRIPQAVFGLLVLSEELPGVLLGFLPLPFYSGKRGRQHKMLFYAAYPVHLLLFYLLAAWLLHHS